MRRYILVFFAVALWVAAGTALATPWSDSLFDSLTHDFGATPYGTQLSHPFVITNNTGKPLHISSVRISCGCLSTSVSRNDVPPGEQATVVVNMDTRRFRGVWAKSVYVQFDRPEAAEVRLTVQANSRDDVTLTPVSLAFGQVASAPSRRPASP